MSNKIGKRGESIFSTIISRFVNPKGNLLDPTFLGEKFPTIDFYIDLLEYSSKRGFFFASVKTTTKGLTSNKSKIKIIVTKDEIELLNKFTVPVYLFGIDEKAEEGYFICANIINSTQNLNGIPTKYPVTITNIEKLWKEVCDYWDNNSEITKFVSSFK